MAINTKTANQIGNEALARIGLPPVESVSPDTKLQRHYAILGQCLAAHLADRLPNSFQQRGLADAIVQIRALSDVPAPPIPTSHESAAEWVQWLLATQSVKAVFKKQKKNADSAPPILKFLASVAKLHDARAILDVKESQVTDLAAVRRSPPQLVAGCESLLMLFFLPQSPGKSTTFARPLIVAQLYPEPTGAFENSFGPSVATRLTPSVDDLFNSNGESRGDYDEITLTDVLGREFPAAALKSWGGFLGEIDARCVELFGGQLHEVSALLFGNYAPSVKVMFVDADKVQAKQWCAIYDELLSGSRLPVTVETAVTGVKNPTSVRLSTCYRGKFLGLMDTRSKDGNGRESAYSLDPTQRLAAMQAGLLEASFEKCILPVNGPPGTGKTSFLRSVLASSWVAAALDEADHPPIVFGTGATNKAVSNVIDAFKEVPGLAGDDVNVSSRWLDGLPSYGWYFPSKQGEKDYPEMMHLTWNKERQAALTPSGGAKDFSSQTILELETTYLQRAREVFEISDNYSLDVDEVVDTLHERIKTNAIQMKVEQQQFADGLIAFSKAWRSALRTAAPARDLSIRLLEMKHRVQEVSRDLQVLEPATEAGALYHFEAKQLLTGWRSLLPSAIARIIFSKRLRNLVVLEDAASAAFSSAALSWTTALPALDVKLSNTRGQMSSLAIERGELNVHISNDLSNLRELNFIRQARQATWRNLNVLMRALPEIPLWEKSAIRNARTYAMQLGERQMLAQDMLWARLDERQDLSYRIELFHLSARYWEGRWLKTQTDEITSKVTEETLMQRLMMLGVIVVATTDKLCSLGKLCACDLLIMDESGQCSPDVAVAALSFAKTAIFVGDTKQLQPIGNLPEHLVKDLAKLAGIEMDDLPPQLSPNGGSAMSVAKRAASVCDQIGDDGMTLLCHYRCHPTVIGYCNDLLYGGKMRYVRTDKPSAAGLPPMAWVDVGDSKPRRRGSSWDNLGELEEIAEWILDSHVRLCKAYQMSLDKVLAVITPMAPQARLAKKFLIERLSPVVGADVMEAMTIGTVHSLQGAEMPVIAFSLVQHREFNPTLFADRDGGFLMNVAVSRAKDCFIIFADRKTLRGAKSDGAKAGNDSYPISRLGAYLRVHGTRLYPRALVIVEAPGKVSAVKKALGLDVEVIATIGSLRQSSLASDGSLEWTPSPPEFMGKLLTHRDLLDDVFVATDDDLAGELIGMHAAQDCLSVLGEVRVNRMRFHAVTQKDLQLAWHAAGPKFDANLLAAALVREYSRLWDERHFRTILPDQGYIGMAKRDLLACVSIQTAGPDRWTVHAILEDDKGGTYQAFVPENQAALSGPKVFDSETATESASKQEGQALEFVGQCAATQHPSLYPPSTTPRILALAADQLGMLPWDTQDHLNALYQEGAAVD